MSDSTTGSIGGTNKTSNKSSSTTNTDAFQKLDVEQFLKLLITELQNQDPLQPADNQQLLTQLSQIKDIAASNKLTETLDSLSLGESISSASGLIGKQITGLDDTGSNVSGVVSKVTVNGGQPRLLVGSQSVSLKNVAEVLPPG
jgi:flagellar basal-body rod modification protein FlgD